MPLKLKRLLAIYGIAAMAALGGFSYAAQKQLGALRLMADTGSARAFEEAVTAVADLSRSFQKIGFTGDSALGKRLCAQALADAQAAETAISVLPFSTQELENLSGFLGRAGDYAGSLCALTDETLGEDDRGHLNDLSAAAAEFAGRLRELQTQLHAGELVMDSREVRPRNVTDDSEGPKLSALLLDYERDFAAPEAFAYEGKFSPAESRAPGTLSEAEARLKKDHFVRCANPYLVNLAAVSAVNGNTVHLLSGEQLPISRSMKKNFLEQYVDFLGR